MVSMISVFQSVLSTGHLKLTYNTLTRLPFAFLEPDLDILLRCHLQNRPPPDSPHVDIHERDIACGAREEDSGRPCLGAVPIKGLQRISKG